jgi:hypothetical protein
MGSTEIVYFNSKSFVVLVTECTPAPQPGALY